MSESAKVIDIDVAKKAIDAEKKERAQAARNDFEALCIKHNVRFIPIIQIENIIIKTEGLFKAPIGFDIVAD